MQVRDVFGAQGRDVAVLGPDALVSEAADIMDERRIGTVVICSDSGRVIGVISERDIIAAVAEGAGDFSSMEVSRLFSEDPVVCSPDDKAEKVSETMRERHFRHMPVVEHGKLVGIVSLGDILAHTLRERGLDELANYWTKLDFL